MTQGQYFWFLIQISHPDTKLPTVRYLDFSKVTLQVVLYLCYMLHGNNNP